MFNPRPQFTKAVSIATATIVKASDSDLAWIEPGTDYRVAAQHMLDRGVQMVAVTLGAGADRLQVRPGARLGHRDRANEIALGEARQITALLVLGAVVQEIMGGDRMHADRHAGERAPRHLLVQHRLVGSGQFAQGAPPQIAGRAGPVQPPRRDVLTSPPPFP